MRNLQTLNGPKNQNSLTHQQFLEAWKLKYPERGNLLNGGETYFYAGKGTTYVRAKCPYCGKTPLGPDNNHHLNIHFEAEWFKCLRCSEGGSLNYLLGIWGEPPKQKESWKSFQSNPSEQKLDPAILARSKGLEGSKIKPGACIPIQKIPRYSPAWQYLKSEGFHDQKILELANTYGIAVCLQGRQMTKCAENTTTNRLIFEIWEGDSLIGWQARWVPSKWPPSPEDLETEKKVQKYLISPGLKKSHLLYNWDIAQDYDMWVVVEGIKKVWKAGPFALGTFGLGNQVKPPEETSNEAHQQYWSVRLARGKRPVGILYDKGGEEIAKQHAKGINSLGGNAQTLHLPEDGPADLDNYTNTEILQIIKNQMGRLPKKYPKI